jgi:DNA invertase Pin-like site-specific DNA recombinase
MTVHRDTAMSNGRTLPRDADARSGNGAFGGGVARSALPLRRTAQEPDTASAVSRGQVAGLHGARARVIGYVTVQHGASGPGGDVAAAIESACERSNWRLLEVVTDRDGGRRSLERPGIGYALGRIASGDAHGLVVGEMMRLVRSQVDLASLIQWFREHDAALIALDLNFDTWTAEGERIADVLITLGEWDKERIARRTRSGLAEAKASGRRVGRPSVSDRPELCAQIRAMRVAGMTLQAIADRLNAEGVTTMRGGAYWRPSSVQAALGYQRPSRRSAPAVRAWRQETPDGEERSSG